MEAIEDRLQRVEHELGLLAGEVAIRHLLEQYLHAVDYQLGDELADCFTETGAWQLPSRRFEGRDAIRSYCAQPSLQTRKHFMSTPRMSVSGNRATATTYWANIRGTEGGVSIAFYGLYRDALVKCADGKWRFEERLVEQEWPPPGSVEFESHYGIAEPPYEPYYKELLALRLARP